jgi:hypothetical protein
MNRTKKTLASLLVTGTAALGVIGCGSSSGDDTTNAAAVQQGTSTTQQGTGTTGSGATQGRGGPGALDSTKLAAAAKTLGVSSKELRAALTAARPSRPSAANGTQPNSGSAGGSGTDPMATMYAAVAKKLGTTSAKVKAALADVLPSGGPGGAGGPGGGQGGPPSGGQGGTPPSGAQGSPPAQSGSSSSSATATPAT